MGFNGGSAVCDSNGNSFYFGADSPQVRSLPLLFRYGIPGFQSGWPPPC